MPRLLPTELLCDLVDRRRVALCLDFDGTIAPLTPNPEEALPSAEIRDAIIALMQYPARILVAVAGGRRADELKASLGIDGPLAIIGTHGLEVINWIGQRGLTAPITHCKPALDKARGWLNSIASSRRGFFVEDKELALALHYRRVAWDEAGATLAPLEQIIARQAPELEVRHGNQVLELLPRVAPDKGFAFLQLIDRHSATKRTAVYFSCNPADEGAFYKVRRYGITVLVGPERQSWAEYRVESRSELVKVLTELAASQ